MITIANNRTDKEKGDPKIGGHAAASASSIHILGAIHLLVKTGFDHIANKPHASPADHAYNYLMNLFLEKDLTRFSLEDCNAAMNGLRAFSKAGEPVFQSYHSAHDPDRHNFFPSGTVGIPPVNAGYLALAYRYAKRHGYNVPDAHFWCLCGDSEFREGSLHEAIPDFADREIGNLTWIVDYNRQSLDGHRITNNNVTGYTDDQRIKFTMQANGWEVIEVRHGRKRLEYFGRDGGADFKKWFENDLGDYELQALLNVKDAKQMRSFLVEHHGKQIKNLEKFLNNIKDNELFEMIRDFGGHDIEVLAQAMTESKKNPNKPCMIIAHTVKGWGLDMAAMAGNHSALPDDDEINKLQKETGLPSEVLFGRFDAKSTEGKFLNERGDNLYKEILAQHDLKNKNQKHFLKLATQYGEIPETLDINFKMANYPHTQWMLGQLTAKLTRIANTPIDKPLEEKQKPLTDFEKSWKLPAELLVSMAPDVGTSTNLNPAMDGKVFGAEVTTDLETELHIKDKTLPDLVPGQQEADRFLRFEIAEGNVVSCVGSFGQLRDVLGIPILPLMTVYDFFIKRALDQYFYDLYWKSSFILVGTPAGVTLSPEGAQHGWKSDFQIPNQITWEPFFAQELDWIFSDAIKRHVMNDNEGRSGVLIRGVTRGINQKDLLSNIKKQQRYKSDPHALLHPSNFSMANAVDESSIAAIDDAEIMPQLRNDVLSGAYYLVDYRGYAGYTPGDNVVHIFAMGSLGTEALKASEKLLERGIYANVIMVTSPDLLIGNLGAENDYHHLRENLQINSTLYVKPATNGHLEAPELVTLSGRRIPIVSVHDGEPGLLDNIGSIIGVRHETLAVRKHSKCGRPVDVYAYHHIDSESVIEACGKVLSETALEQVQVASSAVTHIIPPGATANWQDLWRKSSH
ncbi:MAG: pyruvate dehydrogenase [Bdellovibrionales bacterium]|nr:pyruvate dehydrogenase [Bdellovibrionales bacterium]